MSYIDNDLFKIMAKLAWGHYFTSYDIPFTQYVGIFWWLPAMFIGNTMLCGVKRNSVIIIINFFNFSR